MTLSLSADGGVLGFMQSAVLGGDGTARVLRTDPPPGALDRRASVVLPGSGAPGEGEASR